LEDEKSYDAGIIVQLEEQITYLSTSNQTSISQSDELSVKNDELAERLQNLEQDNVKLRKKLGKEKKFSWETQI